MCSLVFVKVFNPLWVDTCIGWEMWIYFQFSACRDPVFSANLVEEALFSIVWFWCLYKKSGGHSCVDSYLGTLFCSSILHVCFCDSTRRNKQNASMKGRIQANSICRWHDLLPKSHENLYQKSPTHQKYLQQSSKIQNQFREIDSLSIYQQ
jgi:hypothetical protein